jgi:MoaA/NifB/PqqE/SkfB family radical SAM enzyme
MIRARHLRMAGRFLAHRFSELHPYEVQALLLNACNLKCVYCRCPEIKTGLMDTEQWRQAIRGFGRLGTLRIKFQGGEPTLRLDFRELCAEVRAAGIVAAVVTNGTRIAEQPALLDELDEVVVSMDSLGPAVHDLLRGAGSHAAAMRALELSRARGLPTYVNMVLSEESRGEVEGLLGFCEARGIGLHVQPLVFGRAAYDDGARGRALGAEGVRAVHDQLAAWKRAGRPLMFAASSYARVSAWPDHATLAVRSSGPSGCMAGRFYVHVEPNGDVHPCGQHGADFRPGNIVRDGLEAALRNAQTHDCGDCFSAYLTERKDLFALRPRALLEMARRG